MYIEYASIKNFRCLEDFEIFFKPGMNVIVGGNGAGKSSVCEALASGIAGLVYYLDSPNACNVLERDIRADYVKIGNAAFQKKYQLPVTIDTSAVIQDKTYTWRRSHTSELSKATGMKAIDNPVWEYPLSDDDDEDEIEVTQPAEKNSIRDWSKEISTDDNAILPIVAYRRAGGFFLPERSAQVKIKPIKRMDGYHDALKARIADVYSWVFQMEMAKASGAEPKEYTLFKKTISSAMQILRGDESDQIPEIGFDLPSMTFVYSDGVESHSLESQSSGYYWVLWLLLDLTVRSLMLNPQMDSMEQLEGVVLIDEIDLHLHPRWQWNILDMLQKTFPSVQFIVTTHAPIIISACKDANIIRLDSEHQVDYPGSPYAFSVGDVIEYTQGSYGVLPELKEMYTQFVGAYNSKKHDIARTLADRLQEKFPDSTEAKRAATKISFLR